MTAPGIVSRVTPVHTAVRNCTRDEGRPFEIGNQVLISSHRKLLSSTAMVVNVAEKSEREVPTARRKPNIVSFAAVRQCRWSTCQ
jgi:hypothetical protein